MSVILETPSLQSPHNRVTKLTPPLTRNGPPNPEFIVRLDPFHAQELISPRALPDFRVEKGVGSLPGKVLATITFGLQHVILGSSITGLPALNVPRGVTSITMVPINEAQFTAFKAKNNLANLPISYFDTDPNSPASNQWLDGNIDIIP